MTPADLASPSGWPGPLSRAEPRRHTPCPQSDLEGTETGLRTADWLFKAEWEGPVPEETYIASMLAGLSFSFLYP